MIPKDQLISFRGPLGLKCGPHINSGLEVLVVTNGIIEVLLGNERFFAEKGEAIVILPYDVHAFMPQEGACGRVYMFAYTIVEELFKSREMSEIQSGKFEIPGQMYSIIDKQVARINKLPDGFNVKALFFMLVSEYLDSCTVKVRNNRNSLTIRNIVDYIQNNLTEEITLKSVAANFGYNHSVLAKTLKEYSGTSFTDLLNNLRLEKAVHYFYDCNISITEAAFLSGFGSVRNFNRIFSNTLGVTPTEYISIMRKCEENTP